MNTRIFCTGRITKDAIEWNIAPLPADDEVAPDGTLQDMIDIAHADMLAEEWQEYFLEEEWLRHGC